MSARVGVITGRASSFSAAVIEAINRRDDGVAAASVRFGALRGEEFAEYAVLVDRFSHELPSLRAALKSAIVDGVVVINDPFVAMADDKFYDVALASSLGLAVPKTSLLPNQATLKGSVKSQMLECLETSIDWNVLVADIGLPCVLKDAHGNAWNDVFVCRSVDDLQRYYELSGRRTMIVQEYIEWESYVRCICIGREHILPMRYVPHETDPRKRLYLSAEGYLNAPLAERVIRDSLTLVRGLCYDLSTVEWAIRDGVPYIIDAMNPAPDLEATSLPSSCFEWVVSHVADMTIGLAQRTDEDLVVAGQRRRAAQWQDRGNFTSTGLPTGPND